MSDLPASIAPNAGQTTDTRLLERAIRERWPITDKLRAAIVRKLGKIIIHGASPRETIAASRALIQADRLNQQEEQKATPKLHLHGHAAITSDEQRNQLSAIARKLGIGEVFEAAAIEPTTIDSAPVGGGDGNAAEAGTAQDAADADAAAERLPEPGM